MGYEIINPLPHKVIGYMTNRVDGRTITRTLIELNDWDRMKGAAYRWASGSRLEYIRNEEGKFQYNPKRREGLIRMKDGCTKTVVPMGDDEQWDVDFGHWH